MAHATTILGVSLAGNVSRPRTKTEIIRWGPGIAPATPIGTLDFLVAEEGLEPPTPGL
jgi:hypothetical protein